MGAPTGGAVDSEHVLAERDRAVSVPSELFLGALWDLAPDQFVTEGPALAVNVTTHGLASKLRLDAL